ncbi:hypothetical protein NLK61_28340 [Pseudomonas fuscovaginae UPB0736]|uniref:hypothetical protein n=1 Tax=Pseudomonas asplenii TaxID=53407 RepID=UPI0012BB8BE5|nr:MULTISPECIES: hypothetical protein [Pseudomonas]UUQ65049.1 hypothetical protein NLK61_28340 [Pseudomonas fuscovaginae UPB0736]UZE31717.1 hypothetical protein LOY63_13670 [Pseudomonas asplenii]
MPLACRDRRNPKTPDNPLITHPQNPLYDADHSFLPNIDNDRLLNPACTTSNKASQHLIAHEDFLARLDTVAFFRAN